MVTNVLDGAADGIDDAGELDQQPAGGLDDATAMLSDLGIGQFAAQRGQRSMRALLIRAHQPRIAGDIGSEDGGQPAFDLSCGQSGAPNRNSRLDHRLSELILSVNASVAIPFR
jgi:hypothetical protein